MTAILGAAIEFNLRSEPQLELARSLESNGVDVSHVLNVAGPIVEHEAFRAVVHVVFDDDAETPIDLVAWTRQESCEIFRCLGFAAAIGIDQLLNPASYFASQPLLVHRTPLARFERRAGAGNSHETRSRPPLTIEEWRRRELLEPNYSWVIG